MLKETTDVEACKEITFQKTCSKKLDSSTLTVHPVEVSNSKGVM